VKSSSSVIPARRCLGLLLLLLLLRLMLLLQPSGGFDDAVAVVVSAPRSISDAVRRCHDDRVVTCISAGNCGCCGVNASVAVMVDILMDSSSSSTR